MGWRPVNHEGSSNTSITQDARRRWPLGLAACGGSGLGRQGRPRGWEKEARALCLPSRGLYCPAATSHSCLHKFWPGEKGGHRKRENARALLGGGMGVECGGLGPRYQLKPPDGWECPGGLEGFAFGNCQALGKTDNPPLWQPGECSWCGRGSGGRGEAPLLAEGH